MLALEVQDMFNMPAASNPMACGFAKEKLTAATAGFIVYSGIISIAFILWM
jgi:hypothetical protein